MRKIKNLIGLLGILMIISSCSTKTENFIGEWIETKDERNVIIISKNDDGFIFEKNGKKYPATIKDNLIEIMAETTIKGTLAGKDSLILMGEEYKRFNAIYFLGKYEMEDGSGYVEITNQDTAYNVLYSSNNIYDMQMVGEDLENYNRDFKAKYKAGKLEGAFYGSDLGGTFEISTYKKNEIKFTYNYDENSSSDLILKKTGYILLNPNAFVGNYKSLRFTTDKMDDPADFFIRKNGDDFIISDNEQTWFGKWSKGAIHCSNGSSSGTLKFETKDTLIVKGLYYVESGDEFQFVLKSRDASSQTSQNNNTNVQQSNNNQSITVTTSGKYTGNGPCYIINVSAVQSEKDAQNGVAKLTKDGYKAGYLWIPDFASLSGAKYFSVFIGPFANQHDCEVKTEEYRKVNPAAYGLLVSQENKRVEIRGIGKVTTTKK